MLTTYSRVCDKKDLGDLIGIYDNVYKQFLSKYPRDIHRSDIHESFHKEILKQFVQSTTQTVVDYCPTSRDTNPNDEEDEYNNANHVQQINQLTRLCDEITLKNSELTKRLLISQSQRKAESSDEQVLTLVLDSDFSESTTSSDLDEFSFYLPPHVYKNISRVQCISGCIEIKNPFNITERNNKFQLTMNDVNTTIFIQPGCYEITELVSQIERTLSSEVGTNEFMFEYNHIINRVFIRNTLHKPFVLNQTAILDLLGLCIETEGEQTIKYL
jgi:hypothetical protein